MSQEGNETFKFMKPGDIEISSNTTEEEIAKIIGLTFKTQWKTSYDYEMIKPTCFISKEIIDKLRLNNDAINSLSYMSKLAAIGDYLTYEDLSKYPILQEEVIRWNHNGGFCIYLSVVLWCLLYEFGVASEAELKLVQGYYKHPVGGWLGQQRPDLQGKLEQGLHAWITLNGAVLDLSICQERTMFVFPDGPWIIGTIPDGMHLVGWEEPKSIVKDYARIIAKESGLTYYSWITKHKEFARLIG